MAATPRAEKYAGDEFVALDADAFIAAVRRSGESSKVLAARATMSKQAFSYLLTARPRRCRASRRRALAAVLGVPEPVLAGEAPQFVPFFAMLGQEYAHTKPLALTADALMRACVAAAIRDRYSDDAIADVLKAIDQLLRIAAWREALLVGDAAAEPQGFELFSPDPVRRTVPEHVAAVQGLITAVHHILGPWLRGERRLNLDGLLARADVAGAYARGEAVPPIGPSPRPDPAVASDALVIGASTTADDLRREFEREL